jgi:putative chitinase
MSSLTGLITADALIEIAGTAPGSKRSLQRSIVTQAALSLPAMLDQFEITTPLRIAHFASQTAHESDGFCTTVEYASGAAYEGRTDLGNTQAGDGVRYRGRSLIQCTGRANYRNFTLWMRKIIPDAPDFEKEPPLLSEFPWALWGAVWYWSTHRLNVIADRDDAVTVTKVINGGKNGLADRLVRLGRAKSVIARLSAGEVSAAQNEFPVLYRGVKDRDDEVECLQRLLQEAGYYHLTIDGDFGPGTDGALRAYQYRARLKVDGLAGNLTFTALLATLGKHRGAAPWTIAE